MEAFSRYGVARTNMADIAAAAGVGRTALYRAFPDKRAIFRALAQAVQDEALAKAQAALEGRGTFAARLEGALLARDLHLLQIGHSGPHADEIAELYATQAADLAVAANAALVNLLAQAIKAAVAQKAFALKPSVRSAPALALVLRLALEGVKKEVKDVAAFAALARQVIRAILA